jgi:uncharacterized membrane protein YciS (DUF1049 family)
VSDGLGEVESLHGWQVGALGEMLRYPTLYVQRLVEELTFPDSGGQHWTRKLQLRLPTWDTFASGTQKPAAEELRFIVPLGIFVRTRFPDFSVHDAEGRVCPLLTRIQHGYCMMEFSLRQFVPESEREKMAQAKDDSPLAVQTVETAETLFNMFTTVPGEDGAVSANEASASLDALLEGLGTDTELHGEARSLYRRDFAELERVTQYLGFADGEPGGVINLCIEYTVNTARHLSSDEALRREAEAREAARGNGDGAILRSGAQLSAAISSGRHAWRRWRTEVYARSGLGPANYEVLSRTTDHAGSYYFTINKPSDTELTYMGWGSGNSLEEGEDTWSCSLPSVHEHHGPELTSRLPSDDSDEDEQAEAGRGWTIFAFMRPLPRNQVQIVLGATLNLVFAYLAQTGRLESSLGGSATPLFLLTPALLIGYIAHQRRHHYASTTRWLRGVLWIYVVINMIFLISIAFDVAEDASAIGTALTDRISTVVMAGASAGLACAFVLVGGIYFRLVRWLFRITRSRVEVGKREEETELVSFARAARRAGDIVLGAVAAATLTATAAMLFLVSTSEPPKKAVPHRVWVKDPARELR